MENEDVTCTAEAIGKRRDDVDEFWLSQDTDRLLRMLMLVLLAIGIVSTLILLPRGQGLVNLLGLCLAVIAGIGLWLHHRGQGRRVVSWVLWAGWAAISIWAYFVLGISTPGLYGYPVFIMLAGWMLGRSPAMIMSLLSMANLGLLLWATETGWLIVQAERRPLDYFIVTMTAVLLSGLFAVFVSEGFRRQYRRQVELAGKLRARLDALHLAEEKAAQLFQHNPLPCLVTRVADGVICEVNHAWVRDLGWSREEAIGRSVIDFGFWRSAEERQEAFERLAAVQHLPPRPRTLKTRSGEPRAYLIAGEIIEVDGERRMLNTMLDQTQRLQAEEEVRQLNATLEARVDERTAELTQAIARLQAAQEELLHSEKMASLGSLVAGISHDLNTPIGNTLTVATTLQGKVREFNVRVASGELKKSALIEFLQATEEMSDLLVRSCHRAAELVASFKQVAADQASERRRTFDLKELVEDVLATLRPSFKHHPWVFGCSVPEGICCDSFPGPLGQVLSNLVQNACVHALAGRTSGHVDIAASHPVEGWVRLTISDDGKGMEPGTLARIFDPFFTTRLGQGGSGLGLSVSYRIVTSILGGAISAESEPGKGSCFTVMFPVVAPQSL